MRSGHVPKLDEIRAVSNPTIEFYALVGVCVSEAAHVEHWLSDLFHKSSGLSEADAVDHFHRSVRYGHKRDITNKAMNQHLAGSPKSLEAWTQCLAKMETLLGEQTARNLLGHNPVKSSINVVRYPAEPERDADVVVKFEVRQNPRMVMTNKRSNQTEDLGTLYVYAERLSALINEMAVLHATMP